MTINTVYWAKMGLGVPHNILQIVTIQSIFKETNVQFSAIYTINRIPSWEPTSAISTQLLEKKLQVRLILGCHNQQLLNGQVPCTMRGLLFFD